jgi:hypothetical protein
MGWIDPIAVVLVIAVVVSLLRGGRLANLSEIRLRLWPLLFVGLALQILANNLPIDRSWSKDAAVALILGSYVVLIAVVALNRERTGLWLAGLGILMNFSVIALNAGMPVLAEAARLAGAGPGELTFDAKHVLLTDDSRLVFIADVIPLPFMRQVISIGDVFLAVGLGQFLEAQLRGPIHWFKKTGSSEPGSAAGR